MLLFIFRFPWRTIVQDNLDYELLTDTTFWLTVIIAIIAFGLTYLISESIPYKPDKSDYSKRKKAFYFIGFIMIILQWAYNYFWVSSKINNAALTAQFANISSIGFIYQMIGLFILIYLGLCFAFAKILSKRKFGTLFP